TLTIFNLLRRNMRRTGLGGNGNTPTVALVEGVFGCSYAARHEFIASFSRIVVILDNQLVLLLDVNSDITFARRVAIRGRSGVLHKSGLGVSRGDLILGIECLAVAGRKVKIPRYTL